MLNNLFMGLVANTEAAVIESPALFLVHVDSCGVDPEVVASIVRFANDLAILNAKYRWLRRAS